MGKLRAGQECAEWPFLWKASHYLLMPIRQSPLSTYHFCCFGVPG
ncbi:hypothetical protein [Azospirillum argentinense]